MAGNESPNVYRLGIAHLIRLAGSLVVALGILWLLATLLGAGSGLRIALAVLTVGCLLALVVLFVRPPYVLRLDEDGYAVRWVRGAGRSVAAWREVDNVTSRRVGDAKSMVFELKDGSTTIMPLTLLGTDALRAQQDVRERLNAAHGYRKLDRP